MRKTFEVQFGSPIQFWELVVEHLSVAPTTGTSNNKMYRVVGWWLAYQLIEWYGMAHEGSRQVIPLFCTVEGWIRQSHFVLVAVSIEI